MGKFWHKASLLALLTLGMAAGAIAADVAVPQAEWEAMKARMNELEARTSAPVVSSVDKVMDSKYGPDADVTVKHGKLQIGLLTQLWYYNIQKDNQGFFNDPNVNGIADDGAVVGGQGFRIRREELTFKMDINANITSVMMIDPAREIGGYPQLPSNQGNIKRGNNVDATFLSVAKPNGTNSTSQAGFYQTGGLAAAEPRLLQNAYISWHDCLPHHDVTIGQWKPQCGEEGPRDSATLDFAERSMIGYQTDSRAEGVGIDGYWWEVDKPETGGANVTFSSHKANYRIRYQLGAFNSDGSYFTPGDNQNRPNNNNSLDLEFSFLIRPLWDECRGKLELGAAYMGGEKGKSNRGNDPIANPTNDLNRPQNYAYHMNVWTKYEAGWIFSGLRAEVEWARFHDREAPNSVIDVLGDGGGAGADFSQNIGQPFTRQGGYGTLAYNLGKSSICNMPCWLKPVEVLGRYEQFQNIETADLVNPIHTDLFYTKVWTAGVNYYVIGTNAKVQANYNFVHLPSDHSTADRVFHDVKNNSFVLNFQVAF